METQANTITASPADVIRLIEGYLNSHNRRSIDPNVVRAVLNMAKQMEEDAKLSGLVCCQELPNQNVNRYKVTLISRAAINDLVGFGKAQEPATTKHLRVI